MTTDDKTLTEQIETALNDQHGWTEPPADYIAAAVLPIIRKAERDAAQEAAQRIVGEVRLWASINQKMGEGREASRLRAVADDIERLPEETP